MWIGVTNDVRTLAACHDADIAAHTSAWAYCDGHQGGRAPFNCAGMAMGGGGGGGGGGGLATYSSGDVVRLELRVGIETTTLSALKNGRMQISVATLPGMREGAGFTPFVTLDAKRDKVEFL